MFFVFDFRCDVVVIVSVLVFRQSQPSRAHATHIWRGLSLGLGGSSRTAMSRTSTGSGSKLEVKSALETAMEWESAVGQENFCLCVDVFIYAAFLMNFTDSPSISRVQIPSLSFPLFIYFYDTRPWSTVTDGGRIREIEEHSKAARCQRVMPCKTLSTSYIAYNIPLCHTCMIYLWYIYNSFSEHYKLKLIEETWKEMLTTFYYVNTFSLIYSQ